MTAIYMAQISLPGNCAMYKCFVFADLQSRRLWPSILQNCPWTRFEKQILPSYMYMKGCINY